MKKAEKKVAKTAKKNEAKAVKAEPKKAAPVKADAAKKAVTAKKERKHTLKATLKFNGKAHAFAHSVVDSDGIEGRAKVLEIAVKEIRKEFKAQNAVENPVLSKKIEIVVESYGFKCRIATDNKDTANLRQKSFNAMAKEIVNAFVPMNESIQTCIATGK